MHDFTTFAEWRLIPVGAELAVVLRPTQPPAIQFPFPLMAGVGADGRGWLYLSSASGNRLGWVRYGDLEWATASASLLPIGQVVRGRVIALDLPSPPRPPRPAAMEFGVARQRRVCHR